MEREQKRDRGAVLLISIAILALLSLFATAFVRLVNFERRASTNYTDQVRSRLLAKAGIRAAVVELQRLANEKHYNSINDRWVYKLTAPFSETRMDMIDLKLNLLTTTTPSLAMITDPATPEGKDFEATYGTLRHHLRHLGISGVLGKSYKDGLDVYKLKIIDSASQINLNQGAKGNPPETESVERMLKTMLQAASEADSKWTNLTDDSAGELARHVLANRPSVGFKSKAELMTLVTVDPSEHDSAVCACKQDLKSLKADNRVTEDRWLYAGQGATKRRPAIRDMLTVYSWVDEKVIRPWRLNGDARRELPLMPRAPININTAPVQVLTALFAGLKADNGYGEFTIGYAAAGLLADAIDAARKVTPFKSWPQFEQWLDKNDPADKAVRDALTPGSNGNVRVVHALRPSNRGTLYYRVPEKATYEDVSPVWAALKDHQGMRDLVKAALNPNTILNKFGQGANHGGSSVLGYPMPRLVDKSDLTQMTTEGAFDSMGVFEITSLGMVIQKDADQGEALAGAIWGGSIPASITGKIMKNEVAIVASHSEQVVVRIYDVLRLTTQSDFEQHRALMAKGDFIPDYRHWVNLLGYNRPKFSEFQGWPGMISHPVYSLKRQNDAWRKVDSNYVPAVYDGNLTLTNLLGAKVQKYDFVAGFSRGSLEAFKVRCWWDPKDVNLATGEAMDPINPSHPKGTVPPSDVTDRNAWYAKSKSEGGPDWNELQSLAAPKANRWGPVREVGRLSGLADPLDAKVNETPTDLKWWHQGSSLWNGGVALSPFRNLADDGQAHTPSVVAYDSNNLELLQGCSIRFWVQPLADPFLRDEEVLFSFIGSNGSKTGNEGGVARHVGFRVIKRSDGAAGVSIVLQACPSENLNPGGLANDGGANRWHHEDDPDKGGIWRDQVEIDVTPRSAWATTGATGEKSPLKGVEIDPFNPEWLPNSWHWVVINYGFTGRTKNATLADDDETPPGTEANALPQFDISLQVDLKPTQPPKPVFSDGSDPGRIAFMGEWSISPGFGEMHGFDQTNTGHGMVDAKSYLGRWTADPPLGGGPIKDGWPAASWKMHSAKVLDPPNSEDPKTRVKFVYRSEYYAKLWVTPRPLGDFYSCGIGKGGTTTVDKEVVHKNACRWVPAFGGGGGKKGGPTKGGGPGEYKIDQGLIEFPENAIDPMVYVEFIDPKTGNPVSAMNPKDRTIKLTLPTGKTIKIRIPGRWVIPSNGRVAMTPTGKGGNYTITFVPEMMGPDGEPGGPEWKMNLVLTWKEHEKTGQCGCCNAVNTGTSGSPKWDGAYMRAYQEGKLSIKPPNQPDPPNGCNHESGQARIMWKGPIKAGGFRCWVPFKAHVHGIAENAQAKMPSSPGPSAKVLDPNLVCDDCHGCEGCDVDGPMFLGGEPGNQDYLTGGALSDAGGTHAANKKINYYSLSKGKKKSGRSLPTINRATMALAVFDNLVVKNNSARRTDYYDPGIEVDWFEDRFFEASAASDYFNANRTDENGNLLGAAGTEKAESGYGAVYRRGLIELIGTRARLGSITWTAYAAHKGNTSSNQLTYEVGVWRLPGTAPPKPAPWRATDNSDIVDFTPTWPSGDVEVTGTGTSQAPIGFNFPETRTTVTKTGSKTVKIGGGKFGKFGGKFKIPVYKKSLSVADNLYDGLGNADDKTGPEVLVLGIQLKNAFVDTASSGGDSKRATYSKSDPSGGKIINPTGLPTPILETPVFDDVTLTLIRLSPQFLYAEEGVAE